MKTITKVQWIELVQQTDDAIILDVRTPQECAEGILDNAQQLNVLNGRHFMNEIEAFDTEKSYFIYCKSGGRSAQACRLMEMKGFTKLYNLQGGYSKW